MLTSAPPRRDHADIVFLLALYSAFVDHISIDSLEVTALLPRAWQCIHSAESQDSSFRSSLTGEAGQQGKHTNV